MMEPVDLLCVGLTTLDIALHPVAAMPGVDAGLLVPTILLSPAGTAGGTALVAARLGLRTAIASAVGADLQGEAVRNGLEREGVDTRFLVTDPTMPTSTTVLPVRGDGQRGTVHMIGASMTAPLAPGAWELADGARAVHWGGVGYPGLQGDAAAFLARAKVGGAFVTCDLISPQPDALGQLAAILPHVDLFMPSLAEVRVLLGAVDVSTAARRFIELGAGACAVKMGRDGVMMVTSDERITVPAFAIDPVDTTSCGDSLCAGFHAARARGLAPADCLRFASAVAAQVAMGVGTCGALRDSEQVLAFADTAPVVA